jgi:hypothetical protein
MYTYSGEITSSYNEMLLYDCAEALANVVRAIRLPKSDPQFRPQINPKISQLINTTF